jgi:hypothetical protein
MSFDLQVYNGDLVITNSDFATIQGNDKLVQDLLKIALTPAGGNVLNPWYGTLINKSLIGSVLQNDILLSVAQTQLQNAIENLKKLQNLQVQSGQSVSPDEQIAFIQNISITQSPYDPRQYQTTINVLSRAFGKVSAVFTVGNS